MNGYDNPKLGIRSVGTGFTPTGVANSDASAAFFNPASMVFNQNDTLYVEAYAYYAPTDFQYTENSITDKSNEAFLIPGFFVSKRFDNWAVGVGSYIPYAGGGTESGDFQNTGIDLESFAGWFVLTPAVAYTLTLHKTSNKNVLECVKCVCSHDFPARSVVHTT